MSSRNRKTIWLVFLPLTLEIWTVFVAREGAGYRHMLNLSYVSCLALTLTALLQPRHR